MPIQQPTDSWWEKYLEVFPPSQTVYYADEASATHIRTFSADFIYGFLQTQRYAKAVLSTTRNCGSQTMADLLVDARLTHGWQVFERSDPLKIEAILDESLIHRATGGSDVLREQLIHLRMLNHHPEVSLFVLPFHAGFYPGVEDFVLCDSDSAESWTAFTEDSLEWTVKHTHSSTVSKLFELWSLARLHALGKEETNAFLTRKIDQLSQGNVIELDTQTAPPMHYS